MEHILLHFGAVDYQAMVFLNGNLVCEHEGGNTPFTVDISDYIVEGEQSIAVRVFDPSREELIPRGNQSWEESRKISGTRDRQEFGRQYGWRV